MFSHDLLTPSAVAVRPGEGVRCTSFGRMHGDDTYITCQASLIAPSSLMAVNQDTTVRKIVSMSKELEARLRAFRHENHIPTEAEAVRRLITAGLGKIGVETFDQYDAELAGLRQLIEALQKGWISPVQWVGREARVEDQVAKYEGHIRTLEEAKLILAEGASRRLSGFKGSYNVA